MSPEQTAILAFSLAAVLALAATPLAACLAMRTNFLDHPIGYKKHGRSTPYLGGCAVLLAVLVTAIAFGDGSGRFVPVVLGALGLWAIGTIDDRINLSPWLRVAAAVAAALGLWLGDVGWDVFAFGGFDLALTVLWVLGLVNAFNLMDNLDGASSSVAAAATLGIGAFALVHGDAALAGFAFGAAGACMGFLRYNLARPARIFLGDGGSMPLGFVVASLAISAPPVDDLGNGTVLVAAMTVGLLILDTTLVVISRRRRGLSLLTGGRDHLTHRLLGLVGTPRAVAAVLATVQLTLCVLALAIADLGNLAVLWVSAAAVTAGIGAIVFFERRMDRLGADGTVPAARVATSRAE